MNFSLDIVIPVFNEQENIIKTVQNVKEATSLVTKVSIFIVDDGSTDDSVSIIKSLAYANPEIKFLINKDNVGLGRSVQNGIALGSGDYVMEVHGKNDITSFELAKIINHIGECDLVIPFILNQHERSVLRQVISKIFVFILNKTFFLKIKYFNHYVVYKRRDLNLFKIKTHSYFFQAETIIRLIKKHNKSYVEVGVNDIYKSANKTNAFRIGNIIGVCTAYIKLLVDIYFVIIFSLM